MKICWDNLEKIKYNKKIGKWQNEKWSGYFWTYKDACRNCGEPFLTQNNGIYCNTSCSKKGKKLSVTHKKNISKTMSGENNHFYGKHHSEATKRKISKIHKGKKISGEHKRNISEKISGEKHPFYGKHHTEKTKKKLSVIASKRIGNKNPNWKGGISCEPYCDVWLDKDFKESIKERDGYKCLNPCCSKEIEKLNIHHINYIKKDCMPLNLITLCVSCNSKANSDREWHKAWYSAIISKRYRS